MPAGLFKFRALREDPYSLAEKGNAPVQAEDESTTAPSPSAARKAIEFFCIEKDLVSALAHTQMIGYLPSIIPAHLLHLLQDDSERKGLGYLQLLYLCFAENPGKVLFTEAQEKDFKTSIELSAKASAWLSTTRSSISFFVPPFFQLTNFLGMISNINAPVHTTINTTAGIISGLVAGLAGWKITGTFPDDSSNAANVAQITFGELQQVYDSLAKFLLELFLSSNTNENAFAIAVAHSLPISDIKAKLTSSLCDLRFVNASSIDGHLVAPLEQAISYINNGKLPTDSQLNSLVQHAYQSKQIDALIAERADIYETIAALTAEITSLKKEIKKPLETEKARPS